MQRLLLKMTHDSALACQVLMPDPVEGVTPLLLLDGVLSVGIAMVVLVVDDGVDAPELASRVTPLALVTPPEAEEVLPGEPVLPVPKLSVP